MYFRLNGRGASYGPQAVLAQRQAELNKVRAEKEEAEEELARLKGSATRRIDLKSAARAPKLAPPLLPPPMKPKPKIPPAAFVLVAVAAVFAYKKWG